MAICETDVMANAELNIWRSAQTMQSAFKKRSDRNENLIETVLPVLTDMLDFDPNVSIRIAGIKARNVRGTYNHTAKVATIDFRLRDMETLEVLCHELVHAEQYHQGRLQNVWDDRKSCWRYSWSGQKTNKGTTYRAYRKQPHEIEAFDRQGILAREVLKRLGLADPSGIF